MKYFRVIVLFSATLLMSNKCENREKVASVNKNRVDQLIEAGFTHCVVTKEHSEGECGFLLKNKEMSTLELYHPVEWPSDGQQEGLELLIQYHPSRIRQTECLNAQPIILDSVIVVH